MILARSHHPAASRRRACGGSPHAKTSRHEGRTSVFAITETTRLSDGAPHRRDTVLRRVFRCTPTIADGPYLSAIALPARRSASDSIRAVGCSAHFPSPLASSRRVVAVFAHARPAVRAIRAEGPTLARPAAVAVPACPASFGRAAATMRTRGVSLLAGNVPSPPALALAYDARPPAIAVTALRGRRRLLFARELRTPYEADTPASRPPVGFRGETGARWRSGSR